MLMLTGRLVGAGPSVFADGTAGVRVSRTPIADQNNNINKPAIYRARTSSLRDLAFYNCLLDLIWNYPFARYSNALFRSCLSHYHLPRLVLRNGLPKSEPWRQSSSLMSSRTLLTVLEESWNG